MTHLKARFRFTPELKALDAVKGDFNNAKRILEKKLSSEGCANYELLKKEEIQQAKLNNSI